MTTPHKKWLHYQILPTNENVKTKYCDRNREAGNERVYIHLFIINISLPSFTGALPV